MMDLRETTLLNNAQKKGWSNEETAELFREAKAAADKGQPIKTVFEKVAAKTGRKPNSVRNYYYMKLKEVNPEVNAAFIPFEDDEVERLIEQMLLGQAEGKSVRKIAYELGDGDKKAMLRYQNKYRSVLKNDPAYIQQKMESLIKLGKMKAGQLVLKKRTYKRQNFDETLSVFMQNIAKLGKEGEMLITSLNDIFSMPETQKETQSMDEMRSENKLLSQEIRRLLSEKNQLAEEVGQLKKQLDSLGANWNTLQTINTNFLEMSGMERISGLTEYTAALENCLELPAK